jgi:hypothetical protein
VVLVVVVVVVRRIIIIGLSKERGNHLLGSRLLWGRR